MSSRQSSFSSCRTSALAGAPEQEQEPVTGARAAAGAATGRVEAQRQQLRACAAECKNAATSVLAPAAWIALIQVLTGAKGRASWVLGSTSQCIAGSGGG